MPSPPSNSLILVSGASGFIAAHCVLHVLQHSFRVRGTVRSQSKGEYLKDLFDSIEGGKYKGKFEWSIVEDLEKEGGFDDAVKGVDGVLHTASPFHTNIKSPSDLINPAVNGTKSMLLSAHKANKAGTANIKRVVITSSFASIINTETHKAPYTYLHTEWNTDSPNLLEKLGENIPPIHAYRCSKTLAEKAGWEFVEKEGTSFDLVTINPPFVLGPIIHDAPTPESLNTSIAAVWNVIKTRKEGDPPAPNPLAPGGNAIDVRDVAEAHARALIVEKAGGQRIPISSSGYCMQDILDAIHDPANRSAFGEKLAKRLDGVTKGTPGGGAEVRKTIPALSNSQAETILDIKPIPLGGPDGIGVATVKSLWERFAE